MDATLMTTVLARWLRWVKSVRSAAKVVMSSSSLRVSPGSGPPGRIPASAAASSECTADGSPCGSTPPAASASARFGSGQPAVSCPPKTSEVSGGSPLPVKGGVSVTMPAAGWNPAATAAHPAVAVVATEPRAPMNQTPVRTAGADTGCLPGWGCWLGRAGGAVRRRDRTGRVSAGEEGAPASGKGVLSSGEGVLLPRRRGPCPAGACPLLGRGCSFLARRRRGGCPTPRAVPSVGCCGRTHGRRHRGSGCRCSRSSGSGPDRCW